jgi:sarcosine oxidase subunit delta
MKILNCPLNGPRNISEFVWGGEVKAMPDRSVSDREWGAYVFLENNSAGVVREWWCHVPTSFWFIAERNTVTDEIIRTYLAAELFKERVAFVAKPEGGGEGTR